jgi:flagellar protein FliO/FliZ
MILLTGYSGIWAYIRLILVFVFILILAYYGSKLAGNYQNNVLNNKSNIKIVESYRIGGNKLLAIAKIGEDFYAIGVGKDEITLIDKLDASYFDSVVRERDSSSFSGSVGGSVKSFAEQRLNFKEILTKAKEKNKDSDKKDD